MDALLDIKIGKDCLVFPYAEKLGKSVVIKAAALAFKLVESKARRVKNAVATCSRNYN